MRIAVWMLLVCFFALTGCDENPQSGLVKPSVKSVFKPEFAKGFEIWEMSDSSARIVLLNLEHPGDTLQIIQWKNQPIERIACFSTTHIAFVQQLGKLNEMKATGFAELVMNPEVKQRVADGRIVNLTKGHDLDDEVVYDVFPQLMFVYPFGGSSYEKYLENGIGCVQISEYLEQHPLGRAEWIKLFGRLLGESSKADEIFTRIKTSYLEMAALAVAQDTLRPTVFTGSYDSGNWFVPPGNSFAARLLEDAGASYLFRDSIASVNLVLPFEKMFDLSFNCDFWGKVIHEKDQVTLDKMVEEDQRLKELKSYQNRNIFYCNTAFADYHGDAVLAPDLLLADLVAIFHPAALPNHQPVYFQLWKE